MFKELFMEMLDAISVQVELELPGGEIEAVELCGIDSPETLEELRDLILDNDVKAFIALAELEYLVGEEPYNIKSAAIYFKVEQVK